jgi:hypothetical protein
MFPIQCEKLRINYLTLTSWCLSQWCFVKCTSHSRCSRLKPSYEFCFEEFSNSAAPQLKGCCKSKTSIQEYRNEIPNSYKNLCMNCILLHVSITMQKFKNRLSNSTSCSDNALRLLVLVMCKIYWGLQVAFSFWIWGCVLKGCFERGMFWRAKSRLKGIEDFNLEHWGQCPGEKIFGHNRLEILTVFLPSVQPLTCSHLSVSLSLYSIGGIISRYSSYKNEWWVTFLKSWMSTTYFSNSNWFICN